MICFVFWGTVADPDPVSRRRSGSAWLQPESQGDWLFTVGGGRLRIIKSTIRSKIPSSACTRRPDEISTDGNSSKIWSEQIPARGGGDGGGIQPAVGPKPLWLRNHNFGLAQRIMVNRLATSPHDPLGIIDSACKNQLVMFSVQYGPFNPYIPIRSTTIGKSRVAKDPIAMHTSWRSNSDIASVTRSVVAVPFVPCVLICAYQDAVRGRAGNSRTSSPCWDLLATMSGVGYHGYSAGRGIYPVGGAPGGG
ncbi:hypothetical protein F511_29029 [Dorcoceras hygrometricum]|uniref:Uncharacterized protein n=1 Tax=Dorcoceras hygrometricum TaxID=472368 RepID=A0A2Z7BFE7_9LAMI|nr:hypothetical protein F511_29029 [Dorcoceras hygrometricum]